MFMDRPLTAFLVACIVTILLTGTTQMALFTSVIAGADINIVTRIEKGTDWILGQAVEYRENRYGFVTDTEGADAGKIYSQENARVAWTICNYHLDFTSVKHDKWLKAAVEFVLESQAGTRDFHRYYDITQKQWVMSGSFYYWNAHIMALLAQTAFIMHKLPQTSIEYEFWDRVVQRIRSCIDSWIDNSMRSNGSWVFAYPEPRPTRTEDVGMMLNALSCMSGYEQKWGDRSQAEKLSRAAQKTCEWILREQETDRNSWGYGGFYDDDSKALQTTLSNGRTVFGVLAYWTFIGLTVTQPDYEALRRRMIAWTEGFAVGMMDRFGGPGEGRTQASVRNYPKRALAAAEFIRDLTLIWVDLGGSYYWSLAEQSYHWLVGKNEMNLDMQQVNNTAAVRGGFYAGMENSTHVNGRSTTEITAECVEAMLHAMSIDIPEFPALRYSTIFAVEAVAMSLIFQVGRRRRRAHVVFPGGLLKVSYARDRGTDDYGRSH